MDQDEYKDARNAVLAHDLDPADVPEMCFPEMRLWLLHGEIDKEPPAVAEWMRDRQEIWERASRVIEKMSALSPLTNQELAFPGWFGHSAAMLVMMPWATDLGSAVDQMERMLAE